MKNILRTPNIMIVLHTQLCGIIMGQNNNIEHLKMTKDSLDGSDTQIGIRALSIMLCLQLKHSIHSHIIPIYQDIIMLRYRVPSITLSKAMSG